jgi:hemolysin III
LSHLPPAELILIVVGGLFFTVGAICLATHWPNPVPRVFGYHEVWHTFVVAAVICHFVAISSVIHGAGAA